MSTVRMRCRGMTEGLGIHGSDLVLGLEGLRGVTVGTLNAALSIRKNVLTAAKP